MHNWLLEVDGLHEKWEEGELSPWEGEELGQFETADLHAIPQSIRQRLSTAEFQAYDSSRFGRATSCSVSEDNDADNDDTKELFLPPATLEQPLPGPVAGEVRIVRNLTHTQFRACLVKHFNILFQRNEIKWPRRLRTREQWRPPRHHQELAATEEGG